MPQINVASIRHQGLDLIIAPVTPSFADLPPGDQQVVVSELGRRANAAGFPGAFVPVWIVGGRLTFIAPVNLHAAIQSLDYGKVLNSLNGTVNW